MKRNGKAIVLLLFFVMLLLPLCGCETPAPSIYPIGIVVDVDSSGVSTQGNMDYFIDIVVSRSEVFDLLKDIPEQIMYYPTKLYEGVYGNRDNEWISVSLYLSDINRDQISDERTIFYSYIFNTDEIPFSQYKVVIYYLDEDPVVSSEYETSESATYDNPEGYKTVYDAVSETFEREYYEAEVDRSGYELGSAFIFFIIGVFVLLIFVFVLMESLIYLIARKGWKAVLISSSLMLSYF